MTQAIPSPIDQLESLWQRSVQPGKHQASASAGWHTEMEALFSLGIGMEETMRYLFGQKPGLEEFKQWLLERQNAQEASPAGMEDVLAPADLEFWNRNGYLVLKNAIPRSDAEAAQAALWEFLGMDANDSASWYKSHSELRGLMLTFTNHPCLNRNRQSARIRRAYEQVYQSTAIYKNIDKVSFNPPETTHFRFAGSSLHWDTSLKLPIPLGIQGLLYLTDCGAGDGAFHCVPGFHNSIGQWMKELPAGADPRSAVLSMQPVAVPGNAGDLVMWHQSLPHCATPNHGKTPRMVQYLTYLPAGYKEQDEWV